MYVMTSILFLDDHKMKKIKKDVMHFGWFQLRILTGVEKGWCKMCLRRYETAHSVSVRRDSRHGALRRAIYRRDARFL